MAQTRSSLRLVPGATRRERQVSSAARCSRCQARSCSIWSALSGDDIRILERNKTTRRYKTSQTIFLQGSHPHGLFCIFSGTVALRQSSPDGTSRILDLAEAGDSPGLHNFFSGATYGANAEAATGSVLCHVERIVVDRLIERIPKLSRCVLRQMALALDEQEALRVQQTAHSARSRLVAHLLAMRERHGRSGRDGTVRVVLPLSRRDTAGLIGARPETLSRAIAALERDGLVVFEGRGVTLRDIDGLLDEIESPH